MKKAKVVIILAAFSVFGAMALGSGSSSDVEKKEIVEGSQTIAAESENNAENSAITIDEQLLFEKDDVTVTAVGYTTDDIWGDGIKLLIENNSSKDIGIGCDALIVNDYMISDLFSTTVAAGKKTYDTLNLFNSELEAAGIENVGQVEIYFHTFDADSYRTISTIDCVTIQTSAYADMDEVPNDAGQELYNADGIRIVGKYVDEDSFWGAAVLLYIENNSDKNRIVQCDDMSINDYMVTPYFSSDVYAGKKAIDEITLLSNDLEENGITSVDDIELKFRIMDDDFSNAIETDIISFSAK